MTVWAINAGLAISTNAINSTSFASSNAIGTATAIRSSGVVGAAQNNLAAASLASSTKTGARTAQVYSLLTPTFAAQTDSVQVLAFLLAGQAASAAAAKYQAVEIIGQVIEAATQMLDELYGMRTMPLHRPDSDQINALIQQIAAARAATGLNALPSLH
jgi:hypothetical protein